MTSTLTWFQWLASMRLFGVPSSLETPEDAVPLPYADMPAYRPSQELSAFFGDLMSTYGSDLNSFYMHGRIHHTHSPIHNGDVIFAMHEACASIVQRVYRAKEGNSVLQGELPTLRSFYDRLREGCKRNTDEWGNVYWPHDYYGAVEHWDYADWEYEEGCQVRSLFVHIDSSRSHDSQKYLINPLHDKSLTAFALGPLKPAATQQQSTVTLSEPSQSRHGSSS